MIMKTSNDIFSFQFFCIKYKSMVFKLNRACTGLRNQCGALFFLDFIRQRDLEEKVYEIFLESEIDVNVCAY